MPRYWVFPISGLRKDSNEILIYVNGYSFQSAGLGNIQFNNVLVNSQQYLGKIWDRRTVFQINMIFSATIGLICFIIWLFRRSETTFGWLALSSLLWILFISNVLQKIFHFAPRFRQLKPICFFLLLISIVFVCI